MSANVLFVSVILPICVAIGGWIVVLVHNRSLDREIAREQAGKQKVD
jgi:hypothetical protein